jgi:hypothetical protein
VSANYYSGNRLLPRFLDDQGVNLDDQQTPADFVGPTPLLRNILDTDNPNPSAIPHDAADEPDPTDPNKYPQLDFPPAPPEDVKVAPPDDTRRKQIQQRIDDILNTPKSPWIEQNRGRYSELSALSSLLGEEDKYTGADYQRRLNEANNTTKNRYRQIGSGLYDTVLGTTAFDPANTASAYGASLKQQSTDDRTTALRDIAAGRDARPVSLAAGASLVDPTTGQVKVTAPPKPTAPGASGKMSEQEKAQIKAVETDIAAMRREVNNPNTQLSPEDMQDLKIKLSKAERVRNQLIGKYAAKGAKGTVPSTTSAPSGSDATIPSPSGAGTAQEGDVQENSITGARRVWHNGAWVTLPPKGA